MTNKRIQERVAYEAAQQLKKSRHATEVDEFWRGYAIVLASIELYAELRRVRKAKRKRRRRPTLEPSAN